MKLITDMYMDTFEAIISERQVEEIQPTAI